MMPTNEMIRELREIFPQLTENELMRVLAYAQGAASARTA